MKGFLAFFAALASLIGSLFGIHPTASTSPTLVASTTPSVVAVTSPTNINACQGLLNTKLIQCYTQVATNNKDLSGCDKITDYVGRDECYTAVAVAVQDSSGCYKESDWISGQAMCFDEVAAAKNDLSICDATKSIAQDLMTDGGYRDECYGAVAAARKDASVCGDIPTSDLTKRDECYTGVASSTQNVSICGNITDSSSTESFCAQKANPVTPTAASCAAYSGAQKDGCLYEIAYLSTSPDPSICGQITNPTIIQQCYAAIALVTKTPSVCGDITDINAKDSCYARIAQGLQSSSICGQISSSTAQAACVTATNPPTAASCAALPPLTNKTSINNSSAECYINLMQYYYNDSYCTSIPAGEARNYCYNQASYETSDPATCAKIVGADVQSVSDRNQCYQIVGETLNDASICLQSGGDFEGQCLDVVESATRSTSICSILSGTNRDNCYANIAYELNDVSLCNEVVDTSTVSSCIRNVAIVKNEPSLCTNIPAGVDRDECYYQVGWLDANPSACAQIANVKAPNSYTNYPPSQEACYAAMPKQ